MQLAAFLAPLVDIALFNNASLIARRAVVSVGNDGVASASWADVPFTGTVDPSASETLNRMLEGQGLSGAIMVHTRFPLTSGDAENDADVVIWKGRDYTVRAVNDWAEGGAGFVSAACTLTQINPPGF